ncbi:uncharacterized protein LOC135127227 [Zophobas morio]|uniref:uncharacterized protein LOC135127227 n=1 Tax=Zophobas morio TaxID=2755281 RepID=UPI00308359A9
MYTKNVFFWLLLLFFLGQSFPHIVEKNVTESDCENICKAWQTQNEFNADTKTCKCFLPKYLDAVDLTLLTKNAKLLELSVNNETKMIRKRDTSEVTTQAVETPEELGTTVTVATDINTTPPVNPEGIVGQAAPPRRGLPRPSPSRRPREPRPISPEQQRLITQQINDHLDRLNLISDSRMRDREIEAIRLNLRQIMHTTLAQIPRSRMRTVVEETRRRQSRPRTLHSRVVGAPFPNFNENSSEKNEVESAMKEIFRGKKHRFDVVTQDPSLIDE